MPKGHKWHNSVIEFEENDFVIWSHLKLEHLRDYVLEMLILFVTFSFVSLEARVPVFASSCLCIFQLFCIFSQINTQN
jgi:hypothetical protein